MAIPGDEHDNKNGSRFKSAMSSFSSFMNKGGRFEAPPDEALAAESISHDDGRRWEPPPNHEHAAEIAAHDDSNRWQAPADAELAAEAVAHNKDGTRRWQAPVVAAGENAEADAAGRFEPTANAPPANPALGAV